ncbi:phosphate ABC transporter permease PstA [Synechococcus sp. Cruz-9H2]|uniref:phosphate ABC transporter permease PstA n=1 Tax=unclassified Synechococcus TaxID=2626047 RepID=UPI0020CEE4B8|nr:MULTISPECIES: phosphate ABC transporter permease PstA [unclassified Synechococcus]MCP9820537.1 phosphate ABC transporter permease PstA [Synechococcus sp. Cruz-9H2]MCP9864179.1 phosphate ABC transporter permease PstA [Synechococcus sp. Cruz-7E5]MCP9844826.1 phosphate ABC transporter permease PstA [Synechococcus sp. Edmonson 11F2]MCP9856893.1 phosphate ABC transporter permease PstA [Synechococcus sp. Cruz-9C9]MCP9871503.1 phosphate ABC transporter permease PstA [Synechococcus sp. Cruz-7B9]
MDIKANCHLPHALANDDHRKEFDSCPLEYNPLLKHNREGIFYTVLAGLFATLAILPLLLVLGYVMFRGGALMSVELFTQLPSPPGLSGGGIANAILGTFIVTGIASLIAIPVGIGGGIYIAEYSRVDLFSVFVHYGTNVLAGVPSIICGIFIYLLVVTTRLLFGESFSAVAGGLALAVIMIPTVIKTTDEALKLLEDDLRWAAMAVGASKFVTITRVTLPAAFTPIATGSMLGIARAAGETAPLIFTAMFSFYWPEGLFKPIATLSVLVFNYSIMPYEAQNQLALAASFVIVMLILCINLLVHRLGFYLRG